uniref:Uncharacterized protein n=1 Tax=Scophthalmus maximus TaxID=52904 RepID=A0A8D3DDT5_SCOMX
MSKSQCSTFGGRSSEPGHLDTGRLLTEPREKHKAPAAHVFVQLLLTSSVKKKRSAERRFLFLSSLCP